MTCAPSRRRGIPRVSAKRRAQLAREADVKAQVIARVGGRCEACPRLHSGPVRAAVDKHELKSWARGGNPEAEANTIAVCRICHNFIHDNPEDAAVLGLSIHSWEIPRPTTSASSSPARKPRRC